MGEYDFEVQSYWTNQGFLHVEIPKADYKWTKWVGPCVICVDRLLISTTKVLSLFTKRQ